MSAARWWTRLCEWSFSDGSGATNGAANGAGANDNGDDGADEPLLVSTRNDKSSLRSCMRFFGPGYMVAVGYMDPGNWATDIGGGARFEYHLLVVVLASSLIAMMFQVLCVKLGVVTRQDLAQQCRNHFPAWLNWPLYLLAEVAIMATDLAEVIGSAIALYLLFGIPPIWGVLLTALDVLIILKWWGRRYQKYYEAAIFVLVLAVAVCFGIQLGYTKPSFLGILDGFIPRARIFQNSEMLYIAVAILGATVMPHNLYLHASICQQRRLVDRDSAAEEKPSVTDVRLNEEDPSSTLLENSMQSMSNEDVVSLPMDTDQSESSLSTANDRYASNFRLPFYSTNRTITFSTIDTLIALTFAFVINCTILIVGASAFYDKNSENYDVEELQGAYYALQFYVGPVAATLFALALLASGQASTVTGTMAGQIIMSGFLELRLRPILRRMLTRLCAVVPAIVTILVAGESGLNGLLVFSQVILSLQLPFAIMPLVYFTSSKRIMAGGDLDNPSGGERFVNGWPLTIFASLISVFVAGLNAYLVVVEILKLV